MITPKERECIKKANEARLRAAEKDLSELRERGVELNNPLRLIVAGNLPNQVEYESAKQLIFLPVRFIGILLLLIIAPFANLIIFLDWLINKSKLKRRIRQLRTSSSSYQAPQKKTLHALWFLYGLQRHGYSADERLSLLGAWIDVLYGEGSTESLNLRERVDKISERQVKANRPYYEDQSVPHFYFGRPVDVLIRELSNELPAYD